MQPRAVIQIVLEANGQLTVSFEGVANQIVFYGMVEKAKAVQAEIWGKAKSSPVEPAPSGFVQALPGRK